MYTVGNFTSDDCTEEVKEICRNWFFKVSAITELLPRLYVEMALIRCYRFISPSINHLPPILNRIGASIRGVANPLLASYCRTYLVIAANKGSTSLSATNKYLPSDAVVNTLVDDYLYTFKELHGKGIEKFKPSDMKAKEYFKYHSPAVHWLLNSASRCATKDTFKKVISGYRKHCNHSMVLLHILETFPASHYCDNVLNIVDLIKESEGETVPTVTLYAAMGRGLISYPPPQDQKLAVLNEVWKFVRTVNELPEYTNCVAVFIELLLLHYSEREVTILLKDLVKHVKDADDRMKKDIMPSLERIVSLVIANTNDFGVIVTSEYFLSVMDLFRGTRQTQVCKSMLTSFISRQKAATSDPVLIHALFDFARCLHDSLDSLSFDDEVKQIGILICG